MVIPRLVYQQTIICTWLIYGIPMHGTCTTIHYLYCSLIPFPSSLLLSIFTSITLLLTVLVRVTPDIPVLIIASGETVILRCRRPNATIGWSVNETTLGSSTFKGLLFNSTSHSFPNGSQIYSLTFRADESYNGISIMCIASFDIVGQNPEETPPIKIVVQGIQVY